MKCFGFLCVGLCWVGVAIGTVRVTDIFFHRGRVRDRLVWYLSDNAQLTVDRKQVAGKEQVTITLHDATIDDAALLERFITTWYRHGYRLRCTRQANKLTCVCTYKPGLITITAQLMTNIRGLPMTSITLQRTDQEQHQMPGIHTIVLDAGHGGDQVGGQGHGIKEKYSTLRIAKLLRTCLQNKGYRVIMTRTADRHVPLDKRTTLANDLEASVFVSIHHDFAPFDASRRGVHVLYSNNNSVQLAQTMHKYLTSLHFDNMPVFDLGIEQTYPQVTYGTEMPAVLTEILFLSNADDAAILRNRTNLPLIAQALCDGVDAYCAQLGD